MANGEQWTVPATVVRVIDCDTIVLDLDLGWRVYRNDEHLRILGIDAPERGTMDGNAATAWARTVLPAGLRVKVTSQAKPSFERTLGSITLPGGSDFGELALHEGMAVKA